MKTFHLAKRYLSFLETFCSITFFHNFLSVILSALQNFFACRLLSGELHCNKFPRHLFIIESQEIISMYIAVSCPVNLHRLFLFWKHGSKQVQNMGCKNRVIVIQKEKRPGCLSFWIAMTLFFAPCFMHLIFHTT